MLMKNSVKDEYTLEHFKFEGRYQLRPKMLKANAV